MVAIVCPIITALLQWYQSKLMMQGSMSAQQVRFAPIKPINKNSKEITKPEEKKPEDTAMEMQKQMAIITPSCLDTLLYSFHLVWRCTGMYSDFLVSCNNLQ